MNELIKELREYTDHAFEESESNSGFCLQDALEDIKSILDKHDKALESSLP